MYLVSLVLYLPLLATFQSPSHRKVISISPRMNSITHPELFDNLGGVDLKFFIVEEGFIFTH